VVTWAIEAMAFSVLPRILPDVRVTSWQTVEMPVLAIGALNALVPPISGWRRSI
jgi:uncharacterized membrane protein YvlD (DUF360 family)